ncbi:GntR family transcriptional regulator [uncultured Shimia sp.]|uniref:GntR family transcriptional regulator n=1 Tax=uncultured Shimia sp. TaxID=573152 RepID=UPI00262FA8CD|nr:GntR family transcriptional regulator [uncultured Shimia sp.]
MSETRRNTRQSHLALAKQVLSVALERGMRRGDHLPEQTFSEACGVSRTPIRSAFKILEENEILEWRQEEGFFLSVAVADQATKALQALEDAENSLARRILSDRAERRIDEIQSVSALVRRYGATRNTVLLALKILSQDGIATQLPGRAWAFQPMIDSPKSINESFDFRLTAEPQAILAPGFLLDAKRASLLRGQIDDFLNIEEDRITVGGFRRIDTEFHNLIAQCSGNRFVRGSLLAHHRLRKASRRGSSMPNFRLRQAMIEHLEILDSLERNQFDLAADQMVVHLRRSRIRRPEAANRGIPPLMRGPRA